MKILDELTNREMFFLLAGPCVIEGEEMALNIAGHITAITQRLGIPYVFKGSFKRPIVPVWILLQVSEMRKLWRFWLR